MQKIHAPAGFRERRSECAGACGAGRHCPGLRPDAYQAGGSRFRMTIERSSTAR